MPQFEIICLANSRKHGGRCIAGLRTDGAGWIRAVSPLPDGVLYPRNFTLNDGTAAGILDVIQVGFQAPRAAPHQPENWTIDGKPWTLRARPLGDQLATVLKAALQPGPELLRGFWNRVAFANFEQQPASASLALIAPDQIELYHQVGYNWRAQARGRFSLGKRQRACHYDLVVTDPQWEANIVRQGPCTLQQTQARFVVTVSLAEPFGSQCYKLIAAIVVLPPGIAARF